MSVTSACPDSLHDIQVFFKGIYEDSDARHFELSDLATNMATYTLRAIKGVRRGAGDAEQARRIGNNLAIGLSWLASCANRLHFDLEEAVWQKFPYECYTCGFVPCHCGSETPDLRGEIVRARPSDLDALQAMFDAIYPAEARSLERAALHLAEEVGEVSEAIVSYRTRHRSVDFERILLESADYVSCSLGIFNSMNPAHSALEFMKSLFRRGCHRCHRLKCECGFAHKLDFSFADRW